MVLESVSKFLQEQALPYILSILGEKSFLGQLIATNPLLLFGIILLPIFAIWMIALFVDFVKDSWKMPFGVIFDILAILLFPIVPWALFGLAIAAGISYYFLANGGQLQNGIYAAVLPRPACDNRKARFRLDNRAFRDHVPPCEVGV